MKLRYTMTHELTVAELKALLDNYNDSDVVTITHDGDVDCFPTNIWADVLIGDKIVLSDYRVVEHY